MFESSIRITLLCKNDYAFLGKLNCEADPADSLHCERQAKLERAIILDDHLYPGYLVRIGSLVSLRDLGTGTTTRLQLTSDETHHGKLQHAPVDVAVTGALGMTLLGMRIGEDLKWTLPMGHVRYLRICRLLTRHPTMSR